jgi:hypothetical protein
MKVKLKNSGTSQNQRVGVGGSRRTVVQLDTVYNYNFSFLLAVLNIHQQLLRESSRHRHHHGGNQDNFEVEK